MIRDCDLVTKSSFANMVTKCWFQVVEKLDDNAREVLAQVAEGLDLPWKAFEPLLGTAVPEDNGAVAASILDTIQYKAPTLSSVHGAGRAANSEPHVDKGVLTLILPDTAQGLQV